MVGKKDIDLNLRSEPDFWTKSMYRFSTISWYLMLVAIVIACFTLPIVQTYLNEIFALNLAKDGVQILQIIEFCLFVATFLISTTGLIINSNRHRRRNDKYLRSLVFFPILSALCIIAYLLII